MLPFAVDNNKKYIFAVSKHAMHKIITPSFGDINFLNTLHQVSILPPSDHMVGEQLANRNGLNPYAIIRGLFLN